MVIDKRRTLILSTAGHFFGVPLKDDETIANEETVLDNFLDGAVYRILCAQPIAVEDNEVKLKLSNELPVGKNTLVFFKVREKRKCQVLCMISLWFVNLCIQYCLHFDRGVCNLQLQFHVFFNDCEFRWESLEKKYFLDDIEHIFFTVQISKSRLKFF